MKVAVITGASSGIGKEMAKYFSQKGWKLALLARRKDLLDALAAELPTECLAVECDLTDRESINHASKEILLWTQTVDALINNAGIFLPAPNELGSDELWDKQYLTNLMGPVRLTRNLWGQFLNQKAGVIVNISSTLAIRPIANTGAYSALKAALNNWTKTLAIEGAEYGIRANCICPGLVDTPIHPFHNSDNPEHIEAKAQSQHIQPLKRIGEPADIAPLAFHLASDESAWTTGAIINVDGGMLLNS